MFKQKDLTVLKQEAVELQTFNADELFEEEVLERQKGDGEEGEQPEDKPARAESAGEGSKSKE